MQTQKAQSLRAGKLSLKSIEETLKRFPPARESLDMPAAGKWKLSDGAIHIQATESSFVIDTED